MMSFFFLYKIPLILEVKFFLTQLIILLGKYQRNGLKLSQNVNIFLKKLNNMVLLCTILETEKWKRPMKHYVSLIWLIKYFYFFPGKDLFFFILKYLFYLK